MSAGWKQSNWKGQWIWAHHTLMNWSYDMRNCYCYGRKTLQLASEPKTAKVKVSCDNRYELYVNGTFVCRGPARCEPKYQSYDEVDLAPYLKKGKNVIAALMHHLGESSMQSLERGGYGFLMDGEVKCRTGKPIPLITDETWKAKLAEPYNRRTVRYILQLGFQEDYDAGKEENWTAVSYNDKDWPAALIYGPAEKMPYEYLEPRGIPFERETPQQFVEQVGMYVGKNRAGYETAEDIATLVSDEQASRKKATENTFRDVNAALRFGRDHMTVKPTEGNQHHAIVLDAGMEVSGYLNLDIEGSGGEIVDFFFTEHLRPNGEPALKPAKVDSLLVHLCDRYRCRKGRTKHQFFSWKGFRYLVVVFRNVKKPLKVHHIGYTFNSYPVEQRGTFDCSDERLTKIWEVGAYTQQLCMHDAYMDCPWREQAQWWGDARVQWRVNQAAFGDSALFKRGLRQGAQSQIDNGLTYGIFPCEMHGCLLPDYTLVWVCSLWDYFFYTGDDSPIREHFDVVVRAMKYFEDLATDRRGTLGHPGYGVWLFFDWSPVYRGDAIATFTFQYIETLQLGIQMAKMLDRGDLARRWSKQLKAAEAAARRLFWDTKKKIFRDGFDLTKKKPIAQHSQHCNAYAILTGQQPKFHAQMGKHITSILRNHDKLFEQNASIGCAYSEKAKTPIASPFFYAYVFEAMFKTGYGQQAIDGIRKLWGGMLDDGATTFYETWCHTPDDYAAGSACHAWSSSPTYHLSEKVGGVMPTSTAFETVQVKPFMADLEYAAVTTPTPRGAIDVQWERIGKNGIELTVKLPKRITATVELPDGKRRRVTGGKQTFTSEPAR